MSTLYKYPLDLTGTSPTNRVENEEHLISTQEDYLILPEYGVFYTESFQMVDKTTGRVMTSPADYELLQSYADVAQMSGKEACGIILIKQTTVVEEGVLLTYQAVGQEYSQNITILAETLKRLQEDRYQIYWDNIVKPDKFKPEQHMHHADELFGMDKVVEAIDALQVTLLDYINKEITIDDVTNLRVTLDNINDTLDQLNTNSNNNTVQITALWVDVDALKQLTSDHTIKLNQHEDELADHETRMVSAEQSLANHESRIVAAEAEIPPIKARVTTLEEGQENLNTVTGDHESRLVTAESDIVDIQAMDVTQNARLVAEEATSADHETRIVSQESLMTDTRTRLAANETTDAAQELLLADHTARLDATDTALTGIENDAAALTVRVGDNEDQIGALQIVDQSHQDQLTQQAGRLDAVEQTGVDQQQELDGHNAQLTAIETEQLEQNARLQQAETNIGNLNVTTADHTARVGVLESEMDTAQAEIAALQTTVDSTFATTGVIAEAQTTLVTNTSYLVDTTVVEPPEPPYQLTLPSTNLRDQDYIVVRGAGGLREIQISGSIYECPDNLLVIIHLNGWVRLEWFASLSQWVVVAGG